MRAVRLYINPPWGLCKGIRNPNLEIRNPNLEIRNKSKIRNSKVRNKSVPVWVIGILVFGFVSDFEIRISDFEIRISDSLAKLGPGMRFGWNSTSTPRAQTS